MARLALASKGHFVNYREAAKVEDQTERLELAVYTPGWLLTTRLIGATMLLQMPVWLLIDNGSESVVISSALATCGALVLLMERFVMRKGTVVVANFDRGTLTIGGREMKFDDLGEFETDDIDDSELVRLVSVRGKERRALVSGQPEMISKIRSAIESMRRRWSNDRKSQA